MRTHAPAEETIMGGAPMATDEGGWREPWCAGCPLIAMLWSYA